MGVAAAQVNEVWGTAPHVTLSDVTFPPCPPGAPGPVDTGVRGDVYRNQGRNPLPAFFASLAEGLVVEFVPKSDPMVATLLSTRRDGFPDYTQDGFEAAFKQYFNIEEAVRLVESERTLYRMRRR